MRKAAGFLEVILFKTIGSRWLIVGIIVLMPVLTTMNLPSELPDTVYQQDS